MSRFSFGFWRSKPGRQRLPSGGSEFKQDADWVDTVTKSDDMFANDLRREEPVSLLRKMFSRGKPKTQENPRKLPTQSECSALSTSLEEAAENAVRTRNIELLLKLMHQGGDGFVLLPSTIVPKNIAQWNWPVLWDTLTLLKCSCKMDAVQIFQHQLESCCTQS